MLVVFSYGLEDNKRTTTRAARIILHAIEDGYYLGGYYFDVTWVLSSGNRMGSSPFDVDRCPIYDKSISTLRSLGYIDPAGNLVATHDAVTARLGAPWRMPTIDELDALEYSCDTECTMRNGVYGRLVTGRGAYSLKSIFLPAAGYGVGSGIYYPSSYGFYWSSTPYSDDSSYACDQYTGCC